MKPLPLRLGLLAAALFAGLSSRLPAQASAPATASVSGLGFLAGHWVGSSTSGIAMEAMWTAPSGNNVLGTMRQMKEGRASMYEILVAEQAGSGVSLRVKHFNPGLTGREEKDVSDHYAVIELGHDRMLLEKIGGNGTARIAWEKRPGPVLAATRGTLKDGKWTFTDLFSFRPAP